MCWKHWKVMYMTDDLKIYNLYIVKLASPLRITVLLLGGRKDAPLLFRR